MQLHTPAKHSPKPEQLADEGANQQVLQRGFAVQREAQRKRHVARSLVRWPVSPVGTIIRVAQAGLKQAQHEPTHDSKCCQ